MVVSPSESGVGVEIIGDSSGLNQAVSSAIDALGGLQGAAALAGGALATLGAVGLAKATAEAAAFEEQMVEVEKVTDPQTAREMAGAIQEMAAGMPVAHQELSTIAATAGRLGVEGSANIQEFTRVTAEMAVATDLAAEDAADSFARMSTLMEEDISNVRAIGDAINELSNNMAASSSEIVDAATRSSGVLTQLGLSSEEILGLNAAMNEVSASSRIAGTQLRRFGQEIQDPGKVEDLAAALGMSTEEFRRMREESPNELILQMAERFGEGGEAATALRSTLSTTSRQTLAGLSQNLDSVAEAQSAANEEFAAGGSLTEEFEAASSTFNAKVDVTQNRLRNIAIITGERVLPALSLLLGGLNTGIGLFSEINEATDGWAGTVVGLAAAVTGLSLAISALGGAAGLAAIGVGALAAATTILASPLYLAVAAAVALTLAVGTLKAAWDNNWGGIRDITEDGANFVVGMLEWLINKLKLVPGVEVELEEVDFSEAEKDARAEGEDVGETAGQAAGDAYTSAYEKHLSDADADESGYPTVGEARAAGQAAGQAFGEEFTNATDGPISGWSTKIREALESGVQGYVSDADEIEAAPTELSRELALRVVQQSQTQQGVAASGRSGHAMLAASGGQLSAEMLGISQKAYLTFLRRNPGLLRDVMAETGGLDPGTLGVSPGAFRALMEEAGFEGFSASAVSAREARASAGTTEAARADVAARRDSQAGTAGRGRGLDAAALRQAVESGVLEGLEGSETVLVIDAPQDSRMAAWMQENARVVFREESESEATTAVLRGAL